jgi:hypothetical protein
MEYAREAPKSVVFERCPGPLVAAFFDGGPSKIHPIGGCSERVLDVKIDESVTHSISYNLRGLLEFLYLYKRT